jgi:hypothetical protein
MMKKQTSKSKDKGHANERDCIKKRMILGVIEMRVKEVRKIYDCVSKRKMKKGSIILCVRGKKLYSQREKGKYETE